MENRIVVLKMLREGINKVIFGLVLDEEVLVQYPANNIEEALKYFKKNYKEDLISQGINTILVNSRYVTLD